MKPRQPGPSRQWTFRNPCPVFVLCNHSIAVRKAADAVVDLEFYKGQASAGTVVDVVSCFTLNKDGKIIGFVRCEFDEVARLTIEGVGRLSIARSEMIPFETSIWKVTRIAALWNRGER